MGTLDIFKTQENNGRNLHLDTILVCAKHFVAARLVDLWLTVIVWLTRLAFRLPAYVRTTSARADDGCKAR